MESRNSFYLYDRWFFLVKEQPTKLIYSTIPENVLNGITLELDKEKKNITLLCFENTKMITKITTSSLENKYITFKYREKEPQQILVNDNIYVNLILEASISYENVKSINFGKMTIKKKINMNKMCYLEPDFPLNEKINIGVLDIDSYYFNYYKNICEYISINRKKFIEYINSVPEKKEVTITNEVKELTVPSEIYYYDRIYKLVKQERNNAVFLNTEDYYNELKVNYDPTYKNITQISLDYKDSKTSQKKLFELKIVPNSLNGVTTTFKTNVKKTILLSNKEVEQASFDSTLVYDDNNNLMSFNTKITSKKDIYNLTISPVFKNVYSDEFGNEYHLVDRDYSYLLGIARFSFWAYENIKKIFLTKNEK